ncbi:MAG: DUF4422 domain-containing protein [Tannerella sp.]|jgi:hypothetical protein|nr:DUF4422 domain-containing protein [Tannerella sp.]
MNSNGSVIKIFSFYYKNTPVLVADDLYQPVMAGNAPDVSNDKIQGDAAGDNISAKNRNYSELTGLFWVWKNTREDIVGSCHYRRYFTAKPEPALYRLKRLLYYPVGLYKKRYGLIYTGNLRRFLPRIVNREEIEALMGEYDAILPQARKLKYTVREHYGRYHRIEDLTLLESVLSAKCPDYVDAFHVLMNSKSLYANNMFVLHEHHFQDFMAWWFDLLFELESRTDINQYTGYQERVFGFIAERLLNLWFIKNQLKVAELPVIYFKGLKKLQSPQTS